MTFLTVFLPFSSSAMYHEWIQTSVKRSGTLTQKGIYTFPLFCNNEWVIFPYPRPLMSHWSRFSHERVASVCHRVFHSAFDTLGLAQCKASPYQSEEWWWGVLVIKIFYVSHVNKCIFMPILVIMVKIVYVCLNRCTLFLNNNLFDIWSPHPWNGKTQILIELILL